MTKRATRQTRRGKSPSRQRDDARAVEKIVVHVKEKGNTFLFRHCEMRAKNRGRHERRSEWRARCDNVLGDAV